VPAPQTRDEPVRRRPPGRYDEPSKVTQRVVATVLACLFVGLVGAVAFSLYSRLGADPVREQVRRYAVLSDTSVRVDFRVTKDPEATAYCVVRARNAAGAETGRDVVEVGPAPDGAQRVEVSHVLTTVERPVTGELRGCALTRPAGS
jgi:hypothetical protein